MQWRWIEEETVMLVEVLGTWPVIVGIGDREVEWQREKGWNMKREGLRE